MTRAAMGPYVVVAQAVVLCVVVWGALAFGGVYPWGYWPLAVGAALSGAIGLLVARAVPVAPVSPALACALAGIAGAIGAQLIPLPLSVVGLVSPRSIDLLREFDPAFAAGLVHFHSTSVWPRDTLIALVLFTSLALMLAGVARLLSLTGGQRFVELLTLFGVLLSLVGIVQKPLYHGAIYGFWPMEIGRTPFGPFVNKNHFAGWMLMALPLTLALLAGGIASSMARVKPGWRHKVLWFSSPEASRLVLIAVGATVMALSLMLTMSRSGIAAFVVSVAITGWFTSRALESRARRVSATACLALLLAVVVLWTGPELIARRFSSADWSEFNNRRGAWADAWSVARDFALTGTGLNTYWVAALFYQRHELAYFFAQAHSDYFQLAAEGGVLVALPALVCLGVFVRDLSRAWRDPRGSIGWWVRAGAVTSLVAIALQESVDFSLQMPGNAALFAVVCALALHAPESADRAIDPAAPATGPRSAPNLRLVPTARPTQKEDH
jgi:hypothetical protein